MNVKKVLHSYPNCLSAYAITAEIKNNLKTATSSFTLYKVLQLKLVGLYF